MPDFPMYMFKETVILHHLKHDAAYETYKAYKTYKTVLLN